MPRLPALAGGGLTQLGQSFLPDALRSLSNSGSPWVLLAFALALTGGVVAMGATRLVPIFGA